MGNQQGRVALVTGANKGIGYEVARGIAREGATVLIGARRPDAGEAAAKALRDEGLDARMVELDVTKPDTIAAAAALVEREFGKLDILVNNAATGPDMVPPSQADMAHVRATFESNVFGVINLTQAMIPLLKRSTSARIVNVSSDFGSLTLNSDPNAPQSKALSLSYPASKAALNGVSVAFAKEFRGTPIKVNVANPGFTDTDMTANIPHKSGRDAAQGAVAIIRMALIDDEGPHGTFTEEAGVIPW